LGANFNEALALELGVLSFTRTISVSVKMVKIEVNFWLLRDCMRLPFTAWQSSGCLGPH